MDLLEKYAHYQVFLREHKPLITEKLRTEYAKFRDYPRSSIIQDTAFFDCIGLPLAAIALLWMWSTSTINHWIIAIIMVGLGFLIRFYQKYTINVACSYFFDRRKRIDILNAYVDACLSEAVQQSNVDQIDAIIDLYEYYRAELLVETFNYHK